MNEGVCSIKNGDFPASHVSFRGEEIPLKKTPTYTQK